MKEAAHQLNYNDDAILHLIKATMPSEIYGTLYNQDNLNAVITMVKDIYAKKPEPANPPTATGGAAAPFTLIRALNGSGKRVHFQDGESLSDRIDRLTETLYQIDMEGKPTKRPDKPYIMSPRCREGRGEFKPRGGPSSGDRSEGWFKSKGRFKDKSPTAKRSQVSGKVVDKDKHQCFHCRQSGQFTTECPEKDKGPSQKSTDGKKFEDYTYAYGGAQEPQLATATALPQAYEETLTAMQQSLKNQDPLHGLNM